ncbi:MAG: glutamate-5-semialdehyde dehydrogenase [Myxococcales bacterium]|nr:glutamate-5-semialdehyde dehydrogenase [Myxococcales bacterium]
MCRSVREAARVLATADTNQKNETLFRLTNLLVDRSADIIAENHKDIDAGVQKGLSDAMIDRLRLDESRITQMAEAVREVAMLPDPVGRISELVERPNGLMVGRMSIPIGVIGIIYESRPNVTIDAAALCLKSGNAVVLKGGSEAIFTNRLLAYLCRQAAEQTGLPPSCVGFVDSTDRESVVELLRQTQTVDLIIPRGGEGLIRFVVEHSKIPVIQHYKGICHLFVDQNARIQQAVDICINAKAQRPGVCNAMETLLVDEACAEPFFSQLAPRLQAAGVRVKGCDVTRRYLTWSEPVTDGDYDTEYLALILNIRVVAGMDEAIAHIEKHGSGHTDGILTQDVSRAREFVRRVQSSAVVVNASTRFNDGNQLGLGAEIGISTSKLHAYGPMGLQELTSRKFVVFGDGQIRT